MSHPGLTIQGWNSLLIQTGMGYRGTRDVSVLIPLGPEIPNLGTFLGFTELSLGQVGSHYITV